MSIICSFFFFFEKKKNIFNFTGEMKSCSLNVKLLTITLAVSVSKQVGLTGASGANLQQVKLHITLEIKVSVTNNLLCIDACVFLFQHDHFHSRFGVGFGYWVGAGGTGWVISLSQDSLLGGLWVV